MAKKTLKQDEPEYIVSELTKLHPQKGDIFILNINTDDPDILYSDDILDSVDSLADTLEELIGFKVPVLVFGTEIDLNLLCKEEVIDLIAQLQEFLEDVENDETNEDEEHLTDQFS